MTPEMPAVRQRGFEPLQQDPEVLRYAEMHGRITRREVAELCRITLPQAYRLLDQSVSKRLMAREGKTGQSVDYSRTLK